MKGIKVITAFLLIVSAIFSIRLALAMEDEEWAQLVKVIELSRQEEEARQKKLKMEEEAALVGAVAQAELAEKEERELQQKEGLAVAKAIIKSKSIEEANTLRDYLNGLTRIDLKTYTRAQIERIQDQIEAYRNLTGFGKSFIPLEKRTQHTLDELAKKEIELARQREMALIKQKEEALAREAILAKEKTKIVEQPAKEKVEVSEPSIHIISPRAAIDAGLWPLYPNGYTAEIAPGEKYTFNSPMTYHDINTFKTVIVDDPGYSLPGLKELSAEELNIPADNKVRRLVQLKTFNQEVFENANSLCWALAARNALLLSSFIYTGDINFLKQLPSVDEAKSFLSYYKLNELVARFGAQSMFTKEQVENYMQKNFTQQSAFVINPSLIKDKKITVMVTPFEIDATNWFVEKKSSAFDAARRVQEGLKQKDFFHIFILGEDELPEISGDRKMAGHYMTFVVVKKGHNITYAVADTKADHYYIGPDKSYEYQKLLHFIELLEKGNSSRLSIAALHAVAGKN